MPSSDTLNEPGLGGGFQVSQIMIGMGGGFTAHLQGGLQPDADIRAAGVAEELAQTGLSQLDAPLARRFAVRQPGNG